MARLRRTTKQFLEKLRARAEGETSLYTRKDAIGIPPGFVPDYEVNSLLLDRKISEKQYESIPHLGEPLLTIEKRRLEVIMTGAIRTQIRLNAAGIKSPKAKNSLEYACTASRTLKKPQNISFGTAHSAQPSG